MTIDDLITRLKAIMDELEKVRDERDSVPRRISSTAPGFSLVTRKIREKTAVAIAVLELRILSAPPQWVVMDDNEEDADARDL